MQGGDPVKSPNESLEHAILRHYCKTVRTPAIAANFVSLAEQAVKENHTHIGYLEALLALECEERDRHAIANRIRDSQLPRMKTLEEFDFAQAPQIPAAKIRELAEGGYIERTEPVVLIGDCAKPCWIGSRTERTLLRPGQNRSASGARWRKGGNGEREAGRRFVPPRRSFRLKRAALRASPGSTHAGAARTNPGRMGQTMNIRGGPN